MMIYTCYEFDNRIRANYDLIRLQKEKSLPLFINRIHFIQKCYHYYAIDGKINMLIHNVYDMANNQKKYYHFKTIKKRNGKDRLLSIPNEELMHVLKYINHNVLSWYKPLPCVYAYVKHKGIKQNAKCHLESKYILKLDIKDFFGSIKFGKVVNNILPKDCYEEELRILLANLCMVNGSIPQGSPTSPTLSNIIMHKFDEIMMEYSKEHNLVYTRYADDMVISSKEIFDFKAVISKVKYLLKKYYQMELNDKKTIILHDGMKEEICGVIVNEKLNVSKKYRDEVRQEVYYLKKHGIENHINYLFYNNKLEKNITPLEYYYKLLGKINFILSINKDIKEFVEYKKLIQSFIDKLKPKKKVEEKVRYPKELNLFLLRKNKFILADGDCDHIDIMIDQYAVGAVVDDEELLDRIYGCPWPERDDDFDQDLYEYDCGLCMLYDYWFEKHDFKYLIEDIFKEENLNFIIKEASENIKESVYFFMVYHLNRNDMESFKYWAYKLKELGNYRGIYILAHKLDDIFLLKEAADNYITSAQYEYALTFDEDSKEYYLYMLSAAENYHEEAMRNAVEIYESFKLYEEAFRFICRLALMGDEDYIDMALEYAEKYNFNFPENVEEALDEWGYL